MPLSGTAGAYKIMRDIEDFSLERLWDYILKCPINRCVAKEKLRLVDAILQAWYA